MIAAATLNTYHSFGHHHQIASPGKRYADSKRTTVTNERMYNSRPSCLQSAESLAAPVSAIPLSLAWCYLLLRVERRYSIWNFLELRAGVQPEATAAFAPRSGTSACCTFVVLSQFYKVGGAVTNSQPSRQTTMTHIQARHSSAEGVSQRHVPTRYDSYVQLCHDP